MWLKLTSHDGAAIRVNMDRVTNYYSHDDEGGKTFMEFGLDKDGGTTGVHVKEDLSTIDSLIKPAPISGGWT